MTFSKSLIHPKKKKRKERKLFIYKITYLLNIGVSTTTTFLTLIP